MEALLENNEYTYDTDLNEKLYQMFKENFKRRVARNDENDLVRHHSLVEKRPLQRVAGNEARAPRSL